MRESTWICMLTLHDYKDKPGYGVYNEHNSEFKISLVKSAIVKKIRGWARVDESPRKQIPMTLGARA